MNPVARKISTALTRKKLPRFRSLTYKIFRTFFPVDDNLIFFQSYLGRSISCSPRSMSEYIAQHHPELRIVWSVNKPQAHKATSATIVAPGSVAHYWFIARAKYLVANTGLGDGFEKRSSQLHMQTWHGSTLKRIGRDKGKSDDQRVVRGGAKDDEVLTGFARRVSMWDFLIAPNQISADAFLTAWRFDGEMLHIGYPRNDSIFDAAWTAQQRAKVLKQYNIPDDHVVALWAPTWRDNAEKKNGRFIYELPIDVSKLGPANKVTILAKMHYHVSDTIDDSQTRPYFINVSDWEDINDLFPASDVLVSDFSATIPDYANTGKPIVFFIPDYDEYMETRGTYVDIKNDGPGPLVYSDDELISRLTDLSWVDSFSSNYAKFKTLYGEYEDGHATDRAVKRLLDPTPPRKNFASS